MKLLQVIIAGLFIWLGITFVRWYGGYQSMGERARAQRARLEQPVSRVQSVRAPVSRIATSSVRVVSGDPGKMIVSVGREFDVPAGALYGIWMKESGGLISGWGNGKGWLSAADLAEPGSKCYAHYNAARCGRWWRALEVICAQRRPDGSAVCDPRQVRTSYAMAMGPMQILPTHLVKESADGSVAWTGKVVDFDGDGVVDPHSLPDALAIAAKLIRGFYAEEGDWGRAINRYYGSQTEGYFEGTASVLGVVEHWQNWCAVPGHCRQERLALASN